MIVIFTCSILFYAKNVTVDVDDNILQTILQHFSEITRTNQ